MTQPTDIRRAHRPRPRLLDLFSCAYLATLAPTLGVAA